MVPWAGLAPYLTGESFSSGLAVRLTEGHGRASLRSDILVQMVQGKRIVHVGFADHLPLMDAKIEQGDWLHQRLVESAASCLGVDIDAAAVEHARSKGYDDVVCHDTTCEDVCPAITAGRWDCLLLGEILEHLDEPIRTLRTLCRLYGEYVDKLIVTVPNGFCLANLLNTFRGVEFVNTDHRFWFTPFTMAKAAARAGLSIESMRLCQNARLGRRQVLTRLLVERFPVLRDTLVAVFPLRG